MSQHRFSGGKYSVLCGWDKPLQGFFLVIKEDDEVQYSNLYEAESHPKSFDVFLIVLARFGIDISDKLLDQLYQDKAKYLHF